MKRGFRDTRIGAALLAAWGVVVGAAPHVLHHVGPLAGAALLAGTGGKLLFAAAGLVLAAAGAFVWWSQPTGAVSADPGSEPQRAPLTGTTAEPQVAKREPGAPVRIGARR